jgi:hypothetical protein
MARAVLARRHNASALKSGGEPCPDAGSPRLALQPEQHGIDVAYMRGTRKNQPSAPPGRRFPPRRSSRTRLVCSMLVTGTTSTGRHSATRAGRPRCGCMAARARGAVSASAAASILTRTGQSCSTSVGAGGAGRSPIAPLVCGRTPPTICWATSRPCVSTWGWTGGWSPVPRVGPGPACVPILAQRVIETRRRLEDDPTRGFLRMNIDTNVTGRRCRLGARLDRSRSGPFDSVGLLDLLDFGSVCGIRLVEFREVFLEPSRRYDQQPGGRPTDRSERVRQAPRQEHE